MTKTIELEIRLPGLRVKRAAGVTDRRTVHAMKAMLRVLWAQPRFQPLVEAVANGKRTLPDLYVAYLTGKIAGLSPVKDDRLLYDARETWLAGFDCSDSHKQRLKQAFRILEALKKNPRLPDAPDLLTTYREQCVKAGTPRAFNYAQLAVRALLRDLFGKRDALYERVADLSKMREAKDGPVGVTVEEAAAIRGKLAPKAAAIWWSMCVTGMGPTEFWGEWTVLSDRVRIRGTKRPGRRWGSEGRDVPLLTTMVRPQLSVTRFGKVLRAVGAKPRQGRKSYSRWLEDAGIPRTRRHIYMGWGVRDIGDRYERHQITAFLAEDKAKMSAILGRFALESVAGGNG